MKQKKNIPLIASIIFAALAISGSLTFLGLQMAKTAPKATFDQEAIEQGIQAYIEKQNAAQIEAQKAQEQAALEQAKDVPPVAKTDHIRGAKDAPISLIEYSDYECPFCKKFHVTAQELLTKYPEKINWIYRHFPLGFHDPLATNQALATECVADRLGNDAFWQYSDAIFETTRSNGNGMTVEQLSSIAVNMGMGEEDFSECLLSKEFQDRVDKDIREGTSSGVSGTPGNFIIHNESGEVRFIPGAYPLDALEAAMNELLEK